MCGTTVGNVWICEFVGLSSGQTFREWRGGEEKHAQIIRAVTIPFAS